MMRHKILKFWGAKVLWTQTLPGQIIIWLKHLTYTIEAMIKRRVMLAGLRNN